MDGAARMQGLPHKYLVVRQWKPPASASAESVTHRCTTEGWVAQPTLPPPYRAIGNQEAVASQRRAGEERGALLHPVLRLILDDLLCDHRVCHQHDTLAPDDNGCKAAIGFKGGPKESEGIRG